MSNRRGRFLSTNVQVTYRQLLVDGCYFALLVLPSIVAKHGIRRWVEGRDDG
jgi:hypothetical protein